ncbi:caspase-8 isoform X2 [Salarias fasciatus]|uniref:Caspase-8 n=2 Tax=Salarias fasciatus TaxID=181472 RepID=A0A672I3Q2_SALFA|nr:caspase-8-like isoform X2 [Salarias fasciatus]
MPRGFSREPSVKNREMDFQQQLLDIGNALRAEEVKSLVFLCTDVLNQNPGSVESASDLFRRLMDRNLLSPEDPQLLRELLSIIQRRHLVRNLRLPNQGRTARITISPYRKLLYELSEQITEENLKDIKFLLYEKLPRKKLAENVTTLEVFLQMEQMDLLGNTDLKELETIIEAVCPVLKRKIQDFKALPAPLTNIIAQEEGRPRSLTDPKAPHQVTPSLVKTGSFDAKDFVKAKDECEILTYGFGVLSTETEKSANQQTGGDTSKKLPAHGKESPEDTEGLRAYPMTSAKRGVCLIVNNYDFMESRGNFRRGTMIDQENLSAVFQWLGFEMEIHKDCDRNKMLSVFQALSIRDHSQMDCLVCCVLSHGVEGSVYGVDDKAVKINELTDPFDGLKCRSLADKPKMFFIQACQGSEPQSAVFIQADGPALSPIESDAVRIVESIPAGADFLLGMSTVPSFVSFRQTDTGSWFIRSLCQNLVQMVPRGSDIVTILTKVNADVSQKSDPSGRRKQMPQPAFSLRKRVIFPVPTAPPPSLKTAHLLKD